MYTVEVQNIIKQAEDFAIKLRHEYFTQEHLLLSLLTNSKIQQLLQGLDVDLVSLTNQTKTWIVENAGHITYGSTRVTPATQQLLQMSLQFALNFNRQQVGVYDLLLAFYHYESQAKFILENSGAEKQIVMNEIKTIMEESSDLGQGEGLGMGSEESSKKDDYLVNLNEKAKANKIDPVIGRDEEIDRVIHVLVRRKKNNPILVGEPGVGKTAVAEGLAKKIVDGEVDESLKDAVIFSLDLGGLMAGTKYRGEFEARLKKVIQKLKTTKHSIMFIDEIHTLIGAGSSSNGGLDASNLLKPMLASGEIRCIGATTYDEYRKVFEKDAALSRRFQKIDVVEPSPEDTKKILHGLKRYFEDHHKVKYTDDALSAAVDLSVKHINGRFLPDKAIDIVDEAGAYAKLKLKDKKVVDVPLVEKVIAKIARIPEKQIVGSEKNRLQSLNKELKMVLFGQDQAIDLVTNAIQLAKSGLRDGEKPIGSFLFCGPTGVGKTELTKQLASQLGINFVRFDMSEFMEKHNVSKLIGAPPGYVGYDQEGALTGAVIKNPHSVILLDEIEKAHPDVLNILLQVMDNGILTDNFGKKADFRQAIIIMTSNVGSSEIAKRTMGIIQRDASQSKPTEAIERAFTPEFRNRLDGIVWFNSLAKQTIREVLDKNLVKLDVLLLAKEVGAEYSQTAKEWLAEKGYDPAMGARPMARLIEEKIKAPLSKEILFGKLEKGGKVFVDVKENDLTFTYTPKKEKKKKPIQEK